MISKNFALIALVSSAFAGAVMSVPAQASTAEIEQLMKEINKLKAQVNELSKKASAAPAAAPSAGPTTKPVIACEAQGDGFFVIPGTSTCLRLSGYVRTGGTYSQLRGQDTLPVNGDKTPVGYEGRFRLNTDVRASTDMGTLRGFARMHLNLTGSASAASSPGVAADLAYGYVSLGGWSMGRQDSAFLFYNSADAAILTTDDGAAPVAISYTLPVGAGVTATLAVENQFQRSASASNSSLGAADLPDLVGAVQVINGPATFKLAGATHQVQDGNTSQTKQGYAVQGGLKYVLSSDTTLWLQGTYANGAMSYLGYGITGSTIASLNDGNEQNANPGTVVTSDASNTLDLSSGWSVLGGLNQKIGNGNLGLVGTYGNQTNKRNSNAIGIGGVEGSTTQLEANYTFKPYAGVNFQPAIAYQKWDLEDDASGASLGASTDRYLVRLRAWREF